MDLNESPEHRAYRAKVRIVVRAEQARQARDPRRRRAWHRKLYDAGFVGMGWPKEYGGQEASPIEQAIVGRGDGARQRARARSTASASGSSARR